MSNKVITAIVFLVAFTAGISIGAARPDDDYEKACNCFLAEQHLSSMLAGATTPEAVAMSDRATKRMQHWLKEMEKFKP